MYTAKQMIVMRRDLHMRKGKIAAQAGHACVTAVLMALERENRLGQVYTQGDGLCLRPSDRPATPLSDWFQHGTAKVCVYVDSEEALLDLDRRAKEASLQALICDTSMTEFHGQPTFTCLALEPLPPEQVGPAHRDAPVLSALCPPGFGGHHL